MIAIVTNMYSRLEESQKPMEPKPGVEVGAVVAVAAAGKEINPTKHNWKSTCEFSEKCLVFVITRVDFCPCPAPMK